MSVHLGMGGHAGRQTIRTKKSILFPPKFLSKSVLDKFPGGDIPVAQRKKKVWS